MRNATCARYNPRGFFVQTNSVAEMQMIPCSGSK
jgi:hypothetical protein